MGLPGFQICKNLAWLNELPPDKAESVFRDCCGSRDWARQMAAERPFAMRENLYQYAERIWWTLTAADHLEAFAAHPKIGSKQSGQKQANKSAEWSSGEQSAVKSAAGDVRDQLARVNRLYEEKFGFIFIVFATGKSADEMLAIAKARLGNSRQTEMRIAADEQRKITAIRLHKLLEK